MDAQTTWVTSENIEELNAIRTTLESVFSTVIVSRRDVRFLVNP